MPREDIASWYSAADYYISASHQEGSGYALLEAMACGCVPIVTDIAPFRKITGGGQYSLLFKPGDDAGLLTCLRSLAGVNQEQWSEAIRQHFTRNLSFKAIAENLSAMVVSLVSK
jgi:glycosyltransferase involved in cell wall biosynthesis